MGLHLSHGDQRQRIYDFARNRYRWFGLVRLHPAELDRRGIVNRAETAGQDGCLALVGRGNAESALVKRWAATLLAHIRSGYGSGRYENGGHMRVRYDAGVTVAGELSRYLPKTGGQSAAVQEYARYRALWRKRVRNDRRGPLVVGCSNTETGSTRKVF